MKKLLKKLMCIAAAAGALSLYRTEQSLEALEQGVIRLHILAASDSLADQTRKLRVRDALLDVSADWFAHCETAEECLAVLTERLPQIERTAAEVLKADGCADAVCAKLEKTDFPPRRYGSMTLPAGRYQALRVQIGTGCGQNWWCVMFPALCLPSALSAETEHGVLAEALPEDALAVALRPEQFEIRLKCVDVCRSVAEWVRRRFSDGASETTGQKNSLPKQ